MAFKIDTKLIIFLLVFSVTISALNIVFNVENQSLKRTIEDYSEEKDLLRAKFLSHTSLGRLADRADEMNMVLSAKNIHSVNVIKKDKNFFEKACFQIQSYIESDMKQEETMLNFY